MAQEWFDEHNNEVEVLTWLPNSPGFLTHQISIKLDICGVNESFPLRSHLKGNALVDWNFFSSITYSPL